MTLHSIDAVIDSSAVIPLRMELYAPDVFPSLNEVVELAADSGTLITVDRVMTELTVQAEMHGTEGRGSDTATMLWAKQHLKEFHAVTPELVRDTTALAQEIANRHQGWYRHGNVADPLVIAVAKRLDCAVVSGEKPDITFNADLEPLSSSNPLYNHLGRFTRATRIPDVCKLYNIPHLDLLAFFRSQHWSF